MDQYEKLASALGVVITSTHKTWQQRADMLKTACSEASVDLEEFLSWFDDDE